MTQTSTPPPPHRPSADRPITDAPQAGKVRPTNSRWTGDKASTFIKMLARSGKVTSCALAVGMSRQSAYRLRARSPNFAHYWEIAMGEAKRRRASARRGKRRVHPLLSRVPLAEMDMGDIPAAGE